MGTIPTISTFTAGAVLTATQQNNIKAAVDFWAAPPMVYAWNSAGITTANSTSTLVALDSTVYDIRQSGDTAQHDNTTNNSRLFIRTSAKYRIYAQVQFATNATGNRVITVRKNSGGSISMGIERAGGDGIVMPRKPLRVPSTSWSDENVWSSLATAATSA